MKAHDGKVLLGNVREKIGRLKLEQFEERVVRHFAVKPYV